MKTKQIYSKTDDIPFLNINAELEAEIKNNLDNGWKSPYYFDEKNVVRRHTKPHDETTVMRSAFDRDIEKIMYVPAYNRYTDKTMCFSFLHNDDITRRALHVQFVSKIARNIGRILGLNQKLIEAIALGHDIGHTPFGHAGERFLHKIYNERTGRNFLHNVHSVRVLDYLYNRNISLQTLDGILCHNGEIAKQVQEIYTLETFEEFDNKVESCYIDFDASFKLVSSTLEGCVVRISDIIAYLGKDRIDAQRVGVIEDLTCFDSNILGRENTKIINNMMVDIIENSYNKPYVAISKEMFNDLEIAKNQNYEFIYNVEGMTYSSKIHLEEMFKKLYLHCIEDLKSADKSSPIFKHHIESIVSNSKDMSQERYLSNSFDDIVVDYIASMTDSYFIMVYQDLFPKDDCDIDFRGYFQLS